VVPADKIYNDTAADKLIARLATLPQQDLNAMPRETGATDEHHQRAIKKEVAKVLVGGFVVAPIGTGIISNADTCAAVPTLISAVRRYAYQQAGPKATENQKEAMLLRIAKEPGVEYIYDLLTRCAKR
jgi:hypothetical protein